MKIRDFVITIAFFLLIAVISMGTLVINIFGIETDSSSEKEQEVLEINGTLENKLNEEQVNETQDNKAQDNGTQDNKAQDNGVQNDDAQENVIQDDGTQDEETQENEAQETETKKKSSREEEKEEVVAIAQKYGMEIINPEDYSLVDKWVVAFTDFQYYTNSFVDDMFLNDLFIKLNAEMSYALSAGTYVESNKVLIGTDDYLFYKSESDGDPIADYKGTSLFTDEAILNITNDMLLLKEELNKRGAELYILIIPNKEQIYCQFMPDTIYRNSLYSPGRQFYDFLNQYTDINVIYPYDALMAEKDNYQLFYKTDTHATRLGSFVIFQEFMKMRYGSSQSLSEMNIKVKSEGFSGDLSILSKIQDTEGKDTVYLVDGQDSALFKDETIMLVGDSFTGYLSNMAEMYFKGVHRLDSALFTMEYVDKLKPDIVIYEAGERRIEYLETEDLYNK